MADPRVLRAMATPLLGQFDPEFTAVMNEVMDLLRVVFQTRNERAFPVVMQYVNGRARIAWPKEVQTTDPVLPFPKGHAFAP